MQFPVTDDHIAAECTILTEYHSVGQYLYWKIGSFHGKEIASNWFEHHLDRLTDKAN